MAKKTALADDVRIPIGDLRADPKNARKHPEQNLALIERSLREHGAARSIAINEKNQLIAGHGVTAAAKRAGFTHVRVIDAKGDELIAVRRAGLSRRAQAELALLDNRTNETSEWDVDVLREMHDKGTVDLAAIFDADTLQELLGADADAPKAGLTDPDDIPEQPKTTTIKRGDLFQLGRHRLLCGDSTLQTDVDRLMAGARAAVVITDPPYNVGLSYGDKTDDDKTDEAYVAWTRAWYAIARALSDSCVALTSGIVNVPMWIADIERTHRILSWVKENQCSRNYIGTTSGFNVWEPVLVFGKAKKCVPRDAFSIPIHIPVEAEGHPCPKSIKAWTWLIENFSDPGDLLYEPFNGSGTTLIASEQLERTCYGMEIEPIFAQLAIDRWQRFTGQKAKKVTR